MSGGQTISTSATKLEAIKFQSSAYGGTVPVVYGVTRIAGNLIWYGGFKAIPRTVTESPGGKGGGVKTQTTTYRYEAALMMALCEGSIAGVGRVWRGKAGSAGGPTGSQIISTSEDHVIVGVDNLVYSVANAAAFATDGGVMSLTGGGPDGPYFLTPNSPQSYWVNGSGQYRFAAWLIGRTVRIFYSYLAAGTVQQSLADLGMSLARGQIGQPTWATLTASYPAYALGYSGIAYVSSAAYDLGTDAQVDNHNFEVKAKLAHHLGPDIPDVDPALVGYDILLDQRYGAGFPAASVASTGQWSDYCIGAGLLLSPALTAQLSASEALAKLCMLTNTGIVWSEGLLKFIPYGDEELTGNGATYAPNLTPIYDLDDSVFLDQSNPIKQTRKPQADAQNHIRIEFLNRANAYNVEVAEAKDQANIDTYGLRSKEIIKAHWICDANTARRIAQLILQRTIYIRNSYTIKLPWNFALLEPMDLVTLTDEALRLDRLPVRITEVDEDEDGQLTVVCEDFPRGVAASALYPSQAGIGYEHNYNAPPGNSQPPVMLEPPARFQQQGVEVLIAARGLGAEWGGCTVWVSLDGVTYRQAGRISGGSRYGTLTGPVASGAVPVQLLGGQLTSVTAAEASSLVTLCYIGGATKEFIAFQTATLTGASAYSLSGIVRGAYGSPTSVHAAGDPFVRVDDALASSGLLDKNYIGKTISIKLTSFNYYGLAEQSLADVAAYPYTITGSGLALRPRTGTGDIQPGAVSDTLYYEVADYLARDTAPADFNALINPALFTNANIVPVFVSIDWNYIAQAQNLPGNGPLWHTDVRYTIGSTTKVIYSYDHYGRPLTQGVNDYVSAFESITVNPGETLTAHIRVFSTTDGASIETSLWVYKPRIRILVFKV